MSITVGTVAVGEAIWRAIAPWKRFKQLRNKRRARLGKPLLPITDEDLKMLPSGTATHTGAGIAISSPFVGMIVNAFVPHIENAIVNIGFAPAMCAPEAASCVTAGQLAIGLVAGVVAMAGGALASWGRKRAEKRHTAELAAAAAKSSG
jgi:hypothetical protein